MLKCGFPNSVIMIRKPPLSAQAASVYGVREPLTRDPGCPFLGGAPHLEKNQQLLKRRRAALVAQYAGARCLAAWTDDCIQIVPVPCNQCTACRLNQAHQKADTAFAESQLYDPKEMWFATFTYDDDHLHPADRFLPARLNPAADYGCDPETGELFADPYIHGDEIVPSSTVDYRDLQLFHKRWRKSHGSFRFLACSEYGGSTLRPHYHAIYFGLDPDKFWFHGKSKTGGRIYISEKMTECWGKGFVTLSPVTRESIGYVARYCVKKIRGVLKKEEELNYYAATGSDPVYKITDGGREKLIRPEKLYRPESTASSNRPGLGAAWYQAHPDWSPDKPMFQYLDVKTGAVKSVYSTRYLDALFEREHEFAMVDIKEARRVRAHERSAWQRTVTDVDPEQDLINAREKANLIVSGLKRHSVDFAK